MRPGVVCHLEFAPDRVFIHALYQGNDFQTLATAEYVDVLSLQLGGPGVVTTGGGWIGGGFGLKAALTGVVMASALNVMTTRSRITTIIHFRTHAGELFLLNNQYTAKQLRMTVLSPAITRIEAAQRKSAASPPSVIDQLRELGQLRGTGTITEDEFQRLKATLLRANGTE